MSDAGPHAQGYGKIEPYTWKAIAAAAATALVQIAADLRRIADAKAGRTTTLPNPPGWAHHLRDEQAGQ